MSHHGTICRLFTERFPVHRHEETLDDHSEEQISMELTAHAYPTLTPATAEHSHSQTTCYYSATATNT